MKLYYGLTTQKEVTNIAHEVCTILGNGANHCAAEMLIETACAETQLGTVPDTTPGNGHGLCQIDNICVKDIQQRTESLIKKLVKDHFHYDIDAVKASELDNNPTLSLIFCRLKYRLIPAQIPTDYLSRAAYWKKYYNTALGAGTVDHYMESAERWLYPDTPQQLGEIA